MLQISQFETNIPITIEQIILDLRFKETISLGSVVICFILSRKALKLSLCRVREGQIMGLSLGPLSY